MPFRHTVTPKYTTQKVRSLHCDRTYYGECVGYRTGAELSIRLHRCQKCIDTQRGLEKVVGSWRQMEGEIKGCREGVSDMKETVTRLQQQRGGREKRRVPWQ